MGAAPTRLAGEEMKKIKILLVTIAICIVLLLIKIKNYFTWHTEEKKAIYEWDDAMESMDRRKDSTFQNLCLDVYYFFYRNFEWIWKPYIITGYIKRAWQLIARPGHWSDKDIWSLDYTIAKFALPRIKRLKEVTHGYPSCFSEPEEWDKVLDEMIFAMDFIANCKEDDYYPDLKDMKRDISKEEWQPLRDAQTRTQNGLDLFGKHFRNLWD